MIDQHILDWVPAISAALTVPVVWFAWVRKVLKERPTFAALRAYHDSFWHAVALKFAGIKQRLLTALVFIAGASVTIYDSLTPLLASVDVTPISSQLPPWAWPVLTMSIIGLMQYFRHLADKRAIADIQTAAITGRLPDPLAPVT